MKSMQEKWDAPFICNEKQEIRNAYGRVKNIANKYLPESTEKCMYIFQCTTEIHGAILSAIITTKRTPVPMFFYRLSLFFRF
jgi:hypothetical protein